MLGAYNTRSSGRPIGRHAEGSVARAIENQTARLPSDAFLWAAAGSIGLSLGLQAAGRRHLSMFVGQWVPTFLLLGLYNKLVKVAGSDRYSSPEEDDRAEFDHEASAETVVADRDEWSLSQSRGTVSGGDGAPYREHAENEFGLVDSPDRYADAPFLPATEAAAQRHR